jgi:hypothetical protein
MVRWMFAALIVASLAVYGQDQAKSSVEVLIEAPTTLSPDVPAVVRVTTIRATGLYEFTVVEGAKVLVELGDVKIGEGVTDKRGTLGAKVTVPDLPDGDRLLKITTESKWGKTEHSQNVKVTRDARIMITTDKPLYQPGQTVNIRALALSGLSLKPVASQPIKFEIEDAKGNKVFKRETKTSDFGVGSLEFLLADEVNMGAYKLTASIGAASATKSFEVKKYVLPKFKVDIKTDKKFYRPQETVKGSLEARYFFGKPVEKGSVTVVANTFDVQMREFAKIDLKTDADGKCEFEVKLPDYFVGQALEKGNAFVSLDISVLDQAEHIENASKKVTVCSQPVLVSLLPESGRLVSGVENTVYAVASNPIGEPQAIDLQVAVAGKTHELKTSDSGFAGFTFVPENSMMRAQQDWNTGQTKYFIDCQVTAIEKGGQKTTISAPLFADAANEALLVRPDKGLYKTGETIKIDVLGVTKTDTIFFDLIRKGLTQVTDMIDLQNGKGQLQIPIPQDLFGTVELHAYKILKNGTIVRDTRLVYIEQTQSLSIKIDTDKPQYLPGDEASIRFEVVDGSGKGIQAALGVMVVDEAVYALQEMQPGLEKVYFMLEQEIMKPQYEIRAGGDLVGAIEGQRQDMAKILLANIEVPARRWQVNTLNQRFVEAAQKVQQVYWALYNQVLGGQDTSKFVRKNDKGERELVPNVVEIACKAGGLGDANDPWGKPITLAKLEEFAGTKLMDYFTMMRSQGQVQMIWHGLERYVQEYDAVAMVNGQWEFVGNLLGDMVDKKMLDRQYTKDGWGDPFTTERLASMGAAFKPANIAMLTDDERKFRIFEALMAYVAEGNVAVVKDGNGWKFKESLLDQLKVSGRVTRSVVTGKEFRLNELGAKHPCFRPDMVLSETLLSNRQKVWNAILKAIASEGVKVLVNDNFQYKADVLKILLDKKYLNPSDVQTPTGAPLTWNEIAGASAWSYEPRAMAYTVIGRKWNELYRLTRQYCIDKGHYEKGRRGRQGRIVPPDMLVPEMLDAKTITKNHLVDPFGGEIRFLVSKDKAFVQWEHEARFIDFVSCGPDGKFDTQDDYKFSVQGYNGYDHASPPQRALHYQKDYQTISRQLWDEMPNDAVEEGGPRTKGFGGGRDFRARGAPGGMPPPAPAKPQAERGMRELEKKAEAPAMADMAKDKGNAEPTTGGETFQEPTRVREWFPETLYWNPQIITDDKGVATMKLPIADSITSWRLTAMANTRNALMGSTTQGITVFQDFFVDIDFPVSLTQNDYVWVPVAVFNYMKESQKVKLEAEAGSWFELLDDPTKIIEIGSNEIKAVYYKIRVTKIGNHSFTVKAAGTKFSDAVRRSVEVVPDGKKYEQVYNGKLPASMTHRLEIPAASIDGSSKIIFKVFPGVMAQIVDGLDGMLRLPGG